MADGDNQQTGASDMGQQPTGENVRVELPTNSGTSENETPNVLARGILQRHMRLDPIMLIFIVAILAGGIDGYLEKGSTISLVASVIFAVLLSFGAYLEGYRNFPLPLMIILAVLAVSFIYRYVQKFKFFPSGLFALLTVLMLLRHGYIMYLKRQRV